jgi:hypothetical protein
VVYPEDYGVEKGVHFLGLCKLWGREIVGWNCYGNQQIVKFVAAGIPGVASLILPSSSMLEP